MAKHSAHPVSVLIGLVFAGLVFQACSGGDSASRPQGVSTVGSITVMPSVSSIEIGQTQQYAAVVKDVNGNILIGATVVWSSSQEGVATIDKNGMAQGLSSGTTAITASQSGTTSQLVIFTVTSAPGVRLAPLPPWLTYCNNSLCAALPQVVVAVCPSGNPSCTPARSTTVVPQVNGVPISGIAFPVITQSVNTSLRLGSGNGAVFPVNALPDNSFAGFIISYAAASVQVADDQKDLISYYHVPPVWGGVTPLNFTTTQLKSDLLDTVFYQHPSYQTGTAAADLHAQGQAIIRAERAITGITTSEHVTAYLLPTDLAVATRDGEGNFSYGNGTITVKYGHPLYIEAVGGILNQSSARLAHEYAHELFNEISGLFFNNPACLNEGIADALAYTTGFLPESDFGPIGLRGLDFTDGCPPQTAIHDIGNCYFWHVKKAGLLTPDFLFRIFHPQHTFAFDSCAQNTLETGNTILVYFTESANGANMIPILDSMRLPHAASYADAKQALGL